MTGAGEGTYRKSIRSGFWYMASVVGQKSLNLVTFFVLARLLTPNDYGIMTIVMFVVIPLNQLTTVSFGDALVQRQSSIEKFLDPLFTLDLFRMVIIAALIYAFGPAIAGFFHVTDPSLVLLIRTSGLYLIVSALGNIRTIYLFKGLDLRKIFYRDVLGQAAYAVAAIGVAFFVQRSAWALLAGLFAQVTVGVISSYVIYPAAPRLSFRFRALAELLGFTKWIYGQEVLDVVIAQIDKIFVGRLMASDQLGIYAKAKDLASTATNSIASMINKVGFAAFAKVQDRLNKVQEGFVKSIDVLVLSSLPFTLLLFVEGGAVVTLFLGQKWLPIVEPLKIFAFGNFLLAFTNIVAPILAALGRPDINFKTNVIRLVVTLPFMYAGYHYFGMNGLAWAVVTTWIVLSGYVLLRAKRLMQIHRKLFYPAFMSATASCGGVFLADLAFRAAYTGPRSAVLNFGILCGLGILYYLLLLLVGRRVGKGPLHTALSIFRELRPSRTVDAIPSI